MPKAPKIKAPEPLPERQPARAPTEAASIQNTAERTKRRLGYGNMKFTPITALAPAATAGKTLLGM